jgi:hypothetical protein
VFENLESICAFLRSWVVHELVIEVDNLSWSLQMEESIQGCFGATFVI